MPWLAKISPNIIQKKQNATDTIVLEAAGLATNAGVTGASFTAAKGRSPRFRWSAWQRPHGNRTGIIWNRRADRWPNYFKGKSC